MNGLQRFILAIVPRRLGQAMEKESRLWVMVCLECGKETSIWDAGGIRFLAAGNPRQVVSLCEVWSAVASGREEGCADHLSGGLGLRWARASVGWG